MVANYMLVRQAEAIAAGTCNCTPTRAHLQALLQLVDALKQAHQERLDVISALIPELAYMREFPVSRHGD